MSNLLVGLCQYLNNAGIECEISHYITISVITLNEYPNRAIAKCNHKDSDTIFYYLNVYSTHVKSYGLITGISTEVINDTNYRK